ncbi:histone deacetylase family protein [Tsuneonella amylolytica]|uniref:histone deacetylase family protein n=1 Tax=Tsuneonella amylolytica TaxID=2338327 RepID=UPI000EA939C0|nr:histone deacetylase family protein [Tsuneonella amylolytica]
MKVFHDPRQRDHAPVRELHNGEWTPFAEVPERLDAIVAAIGAGELPDDRGMDPILAVHNPGYLAFLQTAHDDWLAAGRTGDAIGYSFPVVRRRPLALKRVDARIGAYAMDASSPIAAGTWQSAYWGAQAALAATHAVLGGDRSAFALCRPPGHHCGRDYLGGYCFLNNAAIAARAAEAAGHRVAILDVDYHHGNGTQDLFYEDGGVLFASIHADPRTDYPFFWGHADERGAGEGEGATLNLPLPRGTGWADYAPALGTALRAIADFGATILVVSYGADTFAGDPISQFRIETADYTAMGAAIAGLGLLTAIVMEGGYAVDALGANVAAFLEGFA